MSETEATPQTTIKPTPAIRAKLEAIRTKDRRTILATLDVMCDFYMDAHNITVPALDTEDSAPTEGDGNE